MNEIEAQNLLNKLENWMSVTNETLKTLILKTDNQQLDIQKLAKEIIKLKREKLILTN